jgi:hypothetical protein
MTERYPMLPPAAELIRQFVSAHPVVRPTGLQRALLGSLRACFRGEWLLSHL